MSISVPVLDLSEEIQLLWDKLNTEFQAVLRSGQFIMGDAVKAFEREVAQYLNVDHAIAVNSGTDALIIALRALDISPGDEVITSAFTFFATAEAISMVGATPIFVDIDPNTFNLDTSLIEAQITSRTKAILPVHLYGQSADLDRIMLLADKYSLYVLEDTAQAFGAEYHGKKAGSIGHMGAYSFFPTKNLGAYGDSGLIVTNDSRLADIASMLRLHGSKKKYHNEMLGYNSRMDTIQAAILRVKLPYVDEWNKMRQIVAARYDEMLIDLPELIVPTKRGGRDSHVYHQYTVRIRNRRDQIQAFLERAGIGTMVYYPIPVHKLPVYKNLVAHLPETELAATEVLSLPMWPYLSTEKQQYVVEQVVAAINGLDL